MFGQAILGQAMLARATLAKATLARAVAGRLQLGRLLPPPFTAQESPVRRAVRTDVASDDARFGRLGTLEVRLATSIAEVRSAQRLRYRVFFEQGSASPTFTAKFLRRDADCYDDFCDHLLVIDHAAREGQGAAVVGTYRLQRQDIAVANRGFYTAGEFAIDDLLARHRTLKFLELGRSCVLPSYRTKRTVELLWHGIWSYVRRHNLDVMMGCASLDGVDPDAHALALSFLHHFAKAPEGWHVGALPHRRVDMDFMPKPAIDARSAFRALPLLVKGYLRLGAFCGEGAVVDHAFGSTDVLIVLPVAAIGERYIEHFGGDAQRRAA